MSGYAKGTRKPKKGLQIKDIEVGGIKIKPAVAIVSLLAALYVVFLIGVKLESGFDALLLAAFSFVLFAGLAYFVWSGSIAGLKPFALLIDAFLALSILSLVQALAGYFGIFGPAADLTIERLAFAMTVSAGVAAILLMAVLYFEKEGRDNVFLSASPLNSGLLGFAFMAVCGLAAIGYAYLFFPGPFVLTALNILVFGLMGGIYEESLFRGLLLSRLGQVLSMNYALVIQAIVFAVFEALVVYTFMPNPLVLPVVFVAGAILGYFFGLVTLKNESVLAPQMIHAGLYMLAAVLLLTQ